MFSSLYFSGSSLKMHTQTSAKIMQQAQLFINILFEILHEVDSSYSHMAAMTMSGKRVKNT